MEPWIPFDADEGELAQLYVVREGIPTSLRSPILAWIHDALPSGDYNTDYTTPALAHTLEGALGFEFELEHNEAPSRQYIVEAVAAAGDRMILRTVDFFASWNEMDDYGNVPDSIGTLTYFLNLNRSVFEVYRSDQGPYRLRRRLPEGVEQIAQAAIDLQKLDGKHLANAWNAAFGLEPNESWAMTEAIRAVEAAAVPVVTPKDKKATLGKVTAAIRDQVGWTLVLDDSDGYPDHREVLVGMLETLAKAQPDRHAGARPSVLQAQAHVQLASTLVHWFASGAVVRVAPTT
jgi:hypothetical protein